MRPALALSTLVLLAACSSLPTPTQAPAFPPVLSVENRGGPAIVVRVDGVEVATVACDSGTMLTPGVGGVPPLPWAMTVIRQRDNAVVLTAQVSDLPKWLVQIGTDVGLGSVPVAGPPGPSCPPSG